MPHTYTCTSFLFHAICCGRPKSLFKQVKALKRRGVESLMQVEARVTPSIRSLVVPLILALVAAHCRKSGPRTLPLTPSTTSPSAVSTVCSRR